MSILWFAHVHHRGANRIHPHQPAHQPGGQGPHRACRDADGNHRLRLDAENAYEATRRIVAHNDNLVLSQAAFEAFLTTCENPSEPNEALRALMARH
nr:DUF1778 domain-containing protein [uncultured Thiodictyon sp.]